jgi:hypothetical protein
MKRCNREARIFSRYVRNWTFVYNPSLIYSGSSIPPVVSRLIGAVHPPESYALDRRMQWAVDDWRYARELWALEPTRLPQ